MFDENFQSANNAVEATHAFALRRRHRNITATRHPRAQTLCPHQLTQLFAHQTMLG